MTNSKLIRGICLTSGLMTVVQTAFAQGAAPARKRHVADPYEAEVQSRSSEFLAKSPSPFSNLLDQSDFDTKGAKLLRATKFSAGAAYGTFNLNASAKWDSGKDKASGTLIPLELFAVYPSAMGLRFGLDYFQVENKSKRTYERYGDRSLKYSLEVIAITVAAATPSGFGGAVIISTNKESSTADATTYFKKRDDDSNYGMILPQLYYANEDLETMFIWKPSQRHETTEKVGVYELKLEYRLSDVHPIADLTRYRNSENDGENESDHFKFEGGMRYVLDRESNIRVIASIEEAFYTSRRSATTGNGAQWGLNISGEHVIQASHVLGYSVQYFEEKAKGQDSDVNSTPVTLASDLSGVVLSYKYVLR